MRFEEYNYMVQCNFVSELRTLGLFGSAFPRGFQLFGSAFGSILGGMLAFGMLWNAEGGFNEFFSSNIALTDN